MPRKALPRIAAVAPGEKVLTLRIQWNTGDESLVDVSGMINSFRLGIAPLRQNPELFRQVNVGEHGADIVWTDDLDMSNDTLWRLAREQSGATMTADAFRRWRERRAYTLDAAAQALGPQPPHDDRLLRERRAPDPARRRARYARTRVPQSRVG